ncbi:MAG TPA: PIG-L family deacetylase [Acidimicrobiales bacterium]
MIDIRTDRDADPLGTVLGLWAHPDDEAYLSGALMALARRAGNRVVCVTATRGEQGTPDPERWPPARLALLREHELRASLAALGVDEHHWLGHADGTCAGAARADAVRDILEVWTEVQPDTVVTFGPDGVTGHPDHQAVWRWATSAWVATGRQARLLCATTTARFADEHADLHDRFDVFLDPDLPLRTPEDDLALLVEPADDVLDQKLAALRAQASQTAGLIEAFGEDRYRRWFSRETFTDGTRFLAQVARTGTFATLSGRATSVR